MKKQHYFNFKKSKSDYNYAPIATEDLTENLTEIRRSTSASIFNKKITKSHQPRSRSNSSSKEDVSGKQSNYRPRSWSNLQVNQGNKQRQHHHIYPAPSDQPLVPSNLISNKSRNEKEIHHLSLPSIDSKGKRHSTPNLRDNDLSLPDQTRLRSGSFNEEFSTSEPSQPRPRSQTVGSVSRIGHYLSKADQQRQGSDSVHHEFSTSIQNQSQPRSQNLERIQDRLKSLKEKHIPSAMKKLEERNAKIENLDDRLVDLRKDAKEFHKTTEAVKKKFWLESCFCGLGRKNMVIIMLLVLIIVAIIVVLSIVFR